ncbi:MAG: uroporphyrinogen decarboxylase family protein [Candidatus Zipacnadales bacterium]
MTAYQRIRRLVNGQPFDRLPAMPIFMTWLARAISRTYRDYCFDYRVLIEGQQYLVDRFEIDCVSVISDAWREAADCGATLTVWKQEPPACQTPLLEDATSLVRLTVPDPLSGGRMTDRIEAVAALHNQYAGQIPVLGWIEGPIAEACCLRGINTLMLDLVDNPRFVEDLLDFATEMAMRFALAQIEAGADIIGMGDAAASLCGPRYYERFVLPREQRIITAIHEAGALVRLHICGDTNGILRLMARTGADIIDLDYPVRIDSVREEMGDQPIIAGNFDPVSILLNGRPENVIRACRRCHEAFKPRHIVCAGCEVPTYAPLSNIEAMFEYARTALWAEQ